MSFFGMFNFDKPGRGVDPNAPKKRDFFLFFDILFRKFWKIMTLSLCYSLLCIPNFILYFFWSTIAFGVLMPAVDPQVITYIGIYLTLFLVTLLGAGPASAGQAYVLRNFARESHAWVWEDCLSETRKNWKQGFLLLLLDIVVITVLVFAAVLYLRNGNAMPLPPMLSLTFGCLAVVCLTVYLMMHFFLYPLMVTLDMRFGTLIKTAMQLTIMKLPQCVLLFFVSLALFGGFLALYFLNVSLVLLFIALGFSLVPFIGYFYATHVIDAVLEKQKDMA